MDNKYWIWFSRLEKINSLQKKKLLTEYGTPEKIWNLSKSSLLKNINITNENKLEILCEQYRNNIDRYEEYINKNNIQIITILDKCYPYKLKNIYDNPVILFAKGNIELLKKDCIAIVGCRKCSEYGKNIAKQISYNLAKQDKCIISGLAKGIDTYSHIGALEACGKTIAVIGNGLDIKYPYENNMLYERIVKNDGLIITEYIIGTKPEKINFPARNRIISGLSDGVVVIEAKSKSGSLITVDFALEQGKEVFAIPGNINNINSVGTNELIKQGAYLVTDYKDIINVCYS